MKKVAVVLMNLGGPDKVEFVERFLFNLFYDKAILNIPNPMRWAIAKAISFFRSKSSKELYRKIGGSPLAKITKRQALLLEKELSKIEGVKYKVFVAMRYWHPFADEAVSKIEKFEPDEITLLPLYPQFSTTTSQSSIEDFKKTLAKRMILPINIVTHFFDHKLFIKAHANLIKPHIKKLKKAGEDFMLLFSAHSLPMSVIKKGDPYQRQIEETVRLIMEELKEKDIEHSISYQSKVGPVKWLSPASEAEIIKVAKQKRSIVIVPIAFVSEHLETLVELDITYKELAVANGIKRFHRVAALGEEPQFIACLANLCLKFEYV